MTRAQLLKQIQMKVDSGVNLDKLTERLAKRNDIELFVKEANNLYRAGDPAVSDHTYDNVLIAALKVANPKSEFLHSVEPEPKGSFGKVVALPERMLSTQKAYSLEEVAAWCDSVISVAQTDGFTEKDTFFKITPKLDGFAAYHFDGLLLTRGNGREGQNITHAIPRLWGCDSNGEPRARLGKGKGEIVVNKAYFEEHLSSEFENTRNVIASVIKEGELCQSLKDAVDAGAIVFYQFNDLNFWIRNKADLLSEIESYWLWAKNSCKYDTDGIVIETTLEWVMREMGATNHHNRWQIAFKKNTEFHEVKVIGKQFQTAKSGRITPVILLEPTKIGGVTISKVTGHNVGNVVKNGIAEGAIVRVCRSGDVIPDIDGVIRPSPQKVLYPETCPSCGSETKLDGDNLFCTNTVDCPAQIESTMEYFFKTIGKCNGFGPVVLSKLHAWGAKSVREIFDMKLPDYIDAGIGERTAKNLLLQLESRAKTPLEDWRFLAAFSIPNVGKGGCERLLSHYTLDEVFDLTVEQVVALDGFGEGTAPALIKTLSKIRDDFEYLIGLFSIQRTKAPNQCDDSPISGNVIVFTGSMQRGKREDMEKQAKRLGAKVSGSVSKNTNILVCGSNVGASKLNAAKSNGTRILSEEEYYLLLESA